MANTQKWTFKYKAPLNKNGKPYWIPIVCKNKDYLVGYMRGGGNLAESLHLPNNRKLPMWLDSTRFNDVIDNEGHRVSELSNDELEKLVSKQRDIRAHRHEHPEHTDGILDPTYFELHCTCGNYYSFKSPDEVPEKSLICGICDNYLIHFVGIDTHNFTFDGTEFR